MFTKFAFLIILNVFCWHVQGSALQQYGIAIDGQTSTERLNSAVRCMNINPQNSVDLTQIMGMWYGSEIIVHSQDFPGVYEYDSCVIIHLADVTDRVRNNNNYNNRGYNNEGVDNNNNYYNRNRNNYRDTQYPTTTTPQYVDNDDYLHQTYAADQLRYLRLVWSEKDSNLEYTLNYTANAPGQWFNVGDQRGSFAVSNSYTQFTGTIQVVKAVNDHLVLTFCGNDARSSIYTVVLSRNRLGLSADELRSIRNLLSRRGLYTETIRKVCNGSQRLTIGSLPMLLLVLLCACWRK